MNVAIGNSIACELSFAVTQVVRGDRKHAPDRVSGKRDADWYLDWGVEVATDLSVTDKSTLNPSLTWPSAGIFTLGGGFSASSESKNYNNYNVFYRLSDLYRPDFFPPDSSERPCRTLSGDKQGSPLVDLDLQIQPFLKSRAVLTTLDVADLPGKKVSVQGEKNVLTQTVYIKETLTGGLNPSWQLTRAVVDPTPSLLSGSKERMHQIIFTFGPLGDTRKTLTPLAEAFHQYQQLKSAVRSIN